MDVKQKQILKKYAVFALMAIACAICMLLIFSPSDDAKTKEPGTAGFNTVIPMPKEKGIVGDKKIAYEQEQVKQNQQEKMHSLSDFATMTGGDKSKPAPGNTAPATQPVYTPKTTSSSIQSSANANRNINRTLGTFYDSPKADTEKERLAKELEEVKARLADEDSRKNAANEQLAIMEKSYQIAAKYIPMGAVPTETEQPKPTSSAKTAVVPISQVVERTVSALQQDVTNAGFVTSFSQPRNMGFITATAVSKGESKNTISACVHEDQTLTDGQSVRLRLLEQMKAGAIVIPRNAIITGTGKIQGERLEITINSLEYAGTILPADLLVYDTDGQKGIFIPGSMEVNAIKEVAGNMGTSAGTSISLAGSPGQQLAADMSKGLIQGASKYLSKKMQVVKVSLKAGYKLMLLPKAN
ncbi:MAG: conjugative transposon protein TraM [Mariniphaga sp.]|nr:conjugative transposon protein TraM [Mariniphaga sp.]